MVEAEKFAYFIFQSAFVLLLIAFFLPLIWQLISRRNSLNISNALDWLIAGAILLFYTLMTDAGRGITKQTDLTLSMIFSSVGIQTILFFLLIWRFFSTDKWQYLQLTKKAIRKNWKISLVFVPLMWGVLLISAILLSLLGPDVLMMKQEAITALQESKNFWLLFFLCIAASLIAPLQEEFIFRGFLFSSLSSLGGKWFAAVLSSLLFALTHLNLLLLFPLFIFGLLLTWAYLRFQTLWVPILAHFFFNSATLIIQLCFRFLNG